MVCGVQWLFTCVGGKRTSSPEVCSPWLSIWPAQTCREVMVLTPWLVSHCGARLQRFTRKTRRSPGHQVHPWQSGPSLKCLVKRREVANLIRWVFKLVNCVGGLLRRREGVEKSSHEDCEFELFGALSGGLKHSFGCTIW